MGLGLGLWEVSRRESSSAASYWGETKKGSEQERNI